MFCIQKAENSKVEPDFFVFIRLKNIYKTERNWMRRKFFEIFLLSYKIFKFSRLLQFLSIFKNIVENSTSQKSRIFNETFSKNLKFRQTPGRVELRKIFQSALHGHSQPWSRLPSTKKNGRSKSFLKHHNGSILTVR